MAVNGFDGELGRWGRNSGAKGIRRFGRGAGEVTGLADFIPRLKATMLIINVWPCAENLGTKLRDGHESTIVEPGMARRNHPRDFTRRPPE